MPGASGGGGRVRVFFGQEVGDDIQRAGLLRGVREQRGDDERG